MLKGTAPESNEVKDGDFCMVISGTHKGKSGIARDLNISKTGHLTITIVQTDGNRFKTLGKNVTVQKANVA
ncbi:hypothetical protein [Solilutibacter silvestris]|uniref:hypothetical protein n=1 Tax=Solilutibacter silvestris TaxID=1645665 RepID=UPI003D348937